MKIFGFSLVQLRKLELWDVRPHTPLFVKAELCDGKVILSVSTQFYKPHISYEILVIYN